MVAQLAADVLPIAQFAVVATFTLLAVIALIRARRAASSGRWMAAAFGSIAVGLLVGTIADVAEWVVPAWLDSARLTLILLFPYLLLRFTATFRKIALWAEVAAAVATSVVVLASLSPELLAGAAIYLVVALGYWVGLSVVTVVRLWRAGSGQPTVARRRMRLMSAATATLAVALVFAAQLGDGAPVAALTVQVVALASANAFGLGFAPPRAIRLSWRRTEDEQLVSGTMAVLRATTAADVADELLPPTARIVGARGVALVDADGCVVAAHGEAVDVGTHLAGTGHEDDPEREVVPLGDRGTLVVWTSPYTPFFGRDEVELLRSMGAVASLALERCDLLEQERARRALVEQAQEEAERAREEATSANQAKNEFLSRMSHELRTPLNAILGFGQVLELSLGDGDDQDSVKHILKAGRHLLALINDVIDLSRIEAGALAISLEPVHAGELINDTVDLIRPLADSRSIQVATGLEGCDVYVLTDRQRCRQVLLNLLSNAVKYNRDAGEVEVRCARTSEEWLRILVRDTGPGIDPSRLERLFEPFDRLDAEGSGVEGTGLGLALSKQLVQRLGGTLDVETAPGQGSTFSIDLPVTEPPTDAPRAEPTPQPATRTTGRTLLLVEDNLANLRVVEAMLRHRPAISVLPAMQGRLAIDLATQHLPDIIVLDLHMPDLSGREVLHRLRADPRTREIPVVVASADATPGRIRQLREDGAFDYLTKPLDLRQFLEVVDAALAQRDAARGQDPGPQTPGGTS